MTVFRQIMQVSKPVKFSRRPCTGSQQYSKEGGVSLMLPVKQAVCALRSHCIMVEIKNRLIYIERRLSAGRANA